MTSSYEGLFDMKTVACVSVLPTRKWGESQKRNEEDGEGKT